MKPHQQSWPSRYLIALALMAIALATRWLLDPWVGNQIPFITLFAAVAAAAWLGGAGPAIVATLLGAAAAHVLFVARATLPDDPGPVRVELLYLVYFTVCALIIALGDAAHRRGRQRARVAGEMRASDSLLQAMIDAMPMLVSYVDRDQRYRFNNATYEQWFGHSRDELRGRHMRDVLGATAYDAVRAAVERALAGETVQFETVLEYQAAGRREVSITYAPHRPDDRVDGFFVLVEDVGERKRAEQARAHLAAIFETADDAVVSKTLDGVVTSWNAGAERLFGHSAADMVGQSIERVIPLDLRDEETHILGLLRRGEPLKHFETERLTRDGRRVPVSLSVSPILDASGRIIGASKIARDISEQRRAARALRESEERFRTLADSAPVLVWRADADGRATWFNRAWLDFVGCTMEQALAREWSSYVHPDDWEGTLAHCRPRVTQREPFEVELRMTRHDGAPRWMVDRGVPMFDAPEGAFSGYIGSCLDITERKQAAQQLAEADRRKDEFLATLAHELRNPLAPILNAAQYMRMHARLDPALQGARDIIERQARHMNRLVDDLLDLSRISRGRVALRKETMPLEDAIAAAVEASRPLFAAAGQHLDVQLPAQPVLVDGDATRLAQVFGNLLGNASKYTPRDGRIELHAALDVGHATVRVRDTGVGIRADMLESIFEMFTQADSSLERRQGGLGIGLTLARELVEMHAGTIVAHSEGEGRGSEFVVRLPLARADAGDVPVAPTAVADAPVATGIRIVVADDNADIASSLAMMLQLDGHEVHTASDGHAAVAAVARLRPDLVVLDIGMPKLNGYDAAERIRAMPGGERIGLIALTGWGQDEDRRRAFAAGFDQHFTKPIEIDELQRAIGAALDRIRESK